MITVNTDYLTPEALELIERAKNMAPRLAERARAAEDSGLVQKETIDEMQAVDTARWNTCVNGIR